MNLSRLAASLRRRKPLGTPQPPIRAELFSVERLEQHAESLAVAQRVVAGAKRGRSIRPRLQDNAHVVIETYRAVVRATLANRPITPAAEWLLDNYHVVDEQIKREIEDRPSPRAFIANCFQARRWAVLEGYPRVFGVAWALVAHTDSALDLQKLTRFVLAYQKVQTP